MAIDQRAGAGSRPSTILGVAWRVLVVAVVNLAFVRLLGLLMGARPTVQSVVLELATGALYALVLMPLARRLPYRRLTRVVALFVPFYWIAYLSNLVEAAFDTTISRGTLIAGAMFPAAPGVPGARHLGVPGPATAPLVGLARGGRRGPLRGPAAALRQHVRTADREVLPRPRVHGADTHRPGAVVHRLAGGDRPRRPVRAVAA